MKWRKLGVVFSPNNNYPWMVSHAANPLAEHIQSDLFRVYFSCRNALNQSSIGYVEFEIRSPQDMLRVSDEPVLDPGELLLQF